MASVAFNKFDGLADGNSNDDFCILSQMSASASMRLGAGSLQGSAQADKDVPGTQQMQLPGMQMASSSKYSHLIYLSEVEEDGK